mmetsp:Transcript_36412/g.71104  ORF Transcript_36412/g.71104 Transcript_36412/m.71104 type:complete len:206 (-) Transcript_36412:194-811(-)
MSSPLEPLDIRWMRFKHHWNFDGKVVVAARSVFELLNGFDEDLDWGNDYRFQDISWRGAFLGTDTWIAPAHTQAYDIRHDDLFPEDDGSTPARLFRKSSEDSNKQRLERLIAEIKAGRRPVKANQGVFDLRDYWRAQHAVAGRKAKIEAAKDAAAEAAAAALERGEEPEEPLLEEEEDDDPLRCKLEGTPESWRCHMEHWLKISS